MRFDLLFFFLPLYCFLAFPEPESEPFFTLVEAICLRPHCRHIDANICLHNITNRPVRKASLLWLMNSLEENVKEIVKDESTKMDWNIRSSDKGSLDWASISISWPYGSSKSKARESAISWRLRKACDLCWRLLVHGCSTSVESREFDLEVTKSELERKIIGQAYLSCVIKSLD